MRFVLATPRIRAQLTLSLLRAAQLNPECLDPSDSSVSCPVLVWVPLEAGPTQGILSVVSV